MTTEWEWTRRARTAWGAMQTHGYAPHTLTVMLGATEPVDLTCPDMQDRVFTLADRLAGTRGDDPAAAAQALADGYHPIAAYTPDWRLEPTASPHTPEGVAAHLARGRWTIMRRMAEGWSVTDSLAAAPDAWCVRSIQRFRNHHMTTEPATCEALAYARDSEWLAYCDDADLDPVGAGLRYGLIQARELPDGHPHRLLLQSQARARRRDRARARAAQAAGEQMTLAV